MSTLALLVALTGPARADDTQRAKELFQQGTTLFNVGEFDKAIEAWQQGYKEKPDPGFLYNIGQAYRLKGDAPKAIFFYRGYLRNSPKATNRADVEGKIATLQKGVEEHTPPPVPVTPPGSTLPPPSVPAATAPPRAPAPAPVQTRPAPVPARPAPVAPRAVAPPPVAAPPLAGPAAPVVVVAAPPPAPELPGENRPIDLSFGVGINSFTSGLNIKGDAPAQFAWNLGAGYTFGRDALGAVSFRLGALINRTALEEGSTVKNTIGFTSLLVEPSLRVRVIDRRLYLTGGLGVGVLVFSNVKSTSVVLATPPTGKSWNVEGAQGGLELRPAVGIQLHLLDWLAVVASPALAFTPKKETFYGTLGRFELMFGVAVLL